MVDFKLNAAGDLELTDSGDITLTESIVQAVRIRLRWFFSEWRLGPGLGFPYFEQLLIKNPNESKLRGLIRDAVTAVDGVTDVTDVQFNIDKTTRKAAVSIAFTTDEETFREEMEIPWQNTD